MDLDNGTPAPDNTGAQPDPVLDPTDNGTPQPSDATPASTDAQPADNPATAGDGEPKPEDKPVLDPDEKDAGENQLTGAPENYEAFTLSEGFAFDEDGKREASELFKSLNLSQAGAQKLLDTYMAKANQAKEAQLMAWAKQRRDWNAEIKARPTYAADRALAQRGLRALVQTDAEKAMFKNTWLSDHPVMFGIFAKVGKMIAEDTPLPTGSQPKSDGSSETDRFPVK